MLEPHPSSEGVAAEAKSEIHEYLHARDERRRLMPRALAVGLASGLAAVAFRASLDGADRLRGEIVAMARLSGPFGVAIPILFSAILAALGLLVVRRFAPEASGSGIPHLEGVLRRHRSFRWAVVLPTKFFGGLLAIASGMVLGREGPTVQMGGAIGMGVAKWLKSTKREALILTAAGAGAGLAAAFNAPLSGLIFVLEELQRDFRPTVFSAAFIAAASADVVTRVVAGQSPVFSVPSYSSTPLAILPGFLILGIASGLLGVVFNKSLVLALNGFARLDKRKVVLATAVVGGIVGAVAYISPNTVGGGHHLVNASIAEGGSVQAIPGLLLLRLTLTIGSYGTGVAGGIFAPLLALGALLGREVGDLAQLMFPQLVVHPGVFGVVGMASLFAAIVRAPLTGIVLIVEMTASYAQMLPLLVACFAAYAVAESLKDLPIYEALLQRDLLRGGSIENGSDPIVLELEVEPGSPFDGLQVRNLGLPSGVVLVKCQEGDREYVPDARTMLTAHQRVTAIISPESDGGVTAFRIGCGEA